MVGAHVAVGRLRLRAACEQLSSYFFWVLLQPRIYD